MAIYGKERKEFVLFGYFRIATNFEPAYGGRFNLLGTASDSYTMQYPVAHKNYSILSACSFIRAELGGLMSDTMSEPRLRNECLP
jgi:hypothetical protein